MGSVAALTIINRYCSSILIVYSVQILFSTVIIPLHHNEKYVFQCNPLDKLCRPTGLTEPFAQQVTWLNRKIVPFARIKQKKKRLVIRVLRRMS